MGFLELLLPSRQYEAEAARWSRTGSFLGEVVRLYQSGKTRKRDIDRMRALGYRVVSQENVKPASLLVDGEPGREDVSGRKWTGMSGAYRSGGVQVVYARNAP
jgi:hypothetical protein